MTDGSAFIVPSLEYNLAENVYLSGGVYWDVDLDRENSCDWAKEFTGYPDIHFTSFRFYF